MAVPVSESIAFSVGITMVKVVYTVGRFQPPTIGHRALIKKVQDAAGPDGRAYVFVSSTMTPKAKNPLESKDKIPLLEHLVKGVTFVDTNTCEPKCGGPVQALVYLLKSHKPDDITLVIGDEYKNTFGKGGPGWGKEENHSEPGEFMFVSSAARDKNIEIKDDKNMSGTKAREYVKLGRKDDFYLAVGANDDASKAAADIVYEKIAAPLKGGGEEEDQNDTLLQTGADAEFEYPSKAGRRRTYRRCRKCGLPKKPETQ